MKLNQTSHVFLGTSIVPKKRINTEDNWMPPRVYRGKSAYEYRSPCGKAFRLCKLDSPKDTVLKKYLEIKESGEDTKNISTLIEQFINSTQFRERTITTQKSYRDCSLRINEVFGEMHPDKVKIHHVRQFMDYRGEESKVRANRELSFFTVMMSWALERAKVKTNPCIGIKRFKEKARTRYIENNEYQVLYDLAPANVQAAMEVAYLCAARQRDVLDLKRADLREEGIYIEQGKTGKKQIKAWTPRLRAAIDLALEQPSQIETEVVIHTKQGQAYTSSGFKAMFKRVKDKAFGHCPKRSKEPDEQYEVRRRKFLSEYPGVLKDCENFTFHDLKSKGISDYTGDKQLFSGHKTYAQMEKYNRKIEVVKIVDSESEYHEE